EESAGGVARGADPVSNGERQAAAHRGLDGQPIEQSIEKAGHPSRGRRGDARRHRTVVAIPAVKDGGGYAFTMIAIFATVVTILADRPEKRPGNLAPIQLITALGAWALIVINSVVVAVACAAGSIALAVAPVATILCAAILFARGTGGEHAARSLPGSVDAVITEIRDLLGGARRHGLNEIDAVFVRSGPRIGVTVPARGRVVVRVHE